MHIRIHVHTDIHVDIHIHSYTYTYTIHPPTHPSLPPSIPPSIHPSIHPSIRPSLRTYIHTYIHTDIQTYRQQATNKRTYIHTYINTYTYLSMSRARVSVRLLVCCLMHRISKSEPSDAGAGQAPEAHAAGGHEQGVSRLRPGLGRSPLERCLPVVCFDSTFAAVSNQHLLPLHWFLR